MNKKTKRNLKKVIAGGMLAITLTICGVSTAKANTEPPIVHSTYPTTDLSVNSTEPPIVH